MVFVPLDALADPGLVVPTVARAVGVRGREDEPLEGLKAALADQQPLLVLDNFEHVAEASAFLVDLIGVCPGLKVLGYEPGPVAPVWRARVRAFSAGHRRSRGSLRRSPSRRQSRLGTGSVRPACGLGYLHSAGWASVGHRAGRSENEAPPPEALRARLEQRLELLTAGPRDLPARQQALRHTLDSSYGLLWFGRGFLGEGRRWLDEALLTGDRAPATVRAKALHGAGTLAHYQGDYAQAKELCAESLALHRQAGDERGVASALCGLALTARTRGDYPTAQSTFEEALEIFRRLGDRQGVARTLGRLGLAFWYAGDNERFRVLVEESLAAFRELEDVEGIGLCHLHLGMVALNEGDPARAQPLLEESLTICRGLGD